MVRSHRPPRVGSLACAGYTTFKMISTFKLCLLLSLTGRAGGHGIMRTPTPRTGAQVAGDNKGGAGTGACGENDQAVRTPAGDPPSSRSSRHHAWPPRTARACRQRERSPRRTRRARRSRSFGKLQSVRFPSPSARIRPAVRCVRPAHHPPLQPPDHAHRPPTFSAWRQLRDFNRHD